MARDSAIARNSVRILASSRRYRRRSNLRRLHLLPHRSMMLPSRLSVLVPRLVAAVLVSSISASALVHAASPQLDLPKKRKTPKSAPAKKVDPTAKPAARPAKGGDVSSKNTGTTTKTEYVVGPDGKPIGTKTTTGVNVPGARTNEGSGIPGRGRRDSGALDLGATGAGTAAGEQGGVNVDPSSPDADEGPDPFGDLPSTRSAARFLYEQLLRIRRPADPDAADIASRLARLGDDGITVARFAFGQDDPVQALAGAKALLEAGTSEDADRIVRMIRGTAPKGSGHLMLGELIERDPVRANVSLLCDLLRHHDTQTRRVAERSLRTRLTAEDLSQLLPALSDKSSEIRRVATDLVTTVDDRVATEILLDRVVDRSPSVAGIAIEHLARAGDETIEFELLRRAFAEPTIRRPHALLLVAIVEREDRQSKEILTPQHAAPLLDGLDSSSMLVRSSSALALAGIGFRSADSEGTGWLDGPVPSALIGVASGSEFFDGFDLLREPAVRRLRQLTGVSHGSDGPKWSRWWSEARYDFRADRAIIPVVAGDARNLVLRVEPGGGDRPFVLAGSELAAEPTWSASEQDRAQQRRGVNGNANVLFLEDRDAEDLVAFLSESGIFGSERLPGPRGTFGTGGRFVEVEVNGRSKSFRFSQLRALPWFDRILIRAEGLRDQQSWQRFPVEGEHGSRRELFLAESAWWQADRSPAERSARLKDLLLSHLAAAAPVDRDEAVAELTAMLADGRTELTAADVDPLMDLLGDEVQFGARAQSLTQLVRSAGDTRPDASGAITDDARLVNERLLAMLHGRFGPFALDALVQVLHDSGRDVVLSSAVDESSLLRVAAAVTLGEGSDDGDLDFLAGLLKDPDPDVKIAALTGLGERAATRAGDRVHASATDPNASVRAAALRATGKIGADGAIDILVRGLTDPDPRNHLPATEGLASLESPESVPLLISLLRGDRETPIQAEARRGLLALGEAAHDELFGAMRAADIGLRRESALLLARQMESRAVPVLAGALAIDRDDTLAAEELAILTCVDYREEPRPSDRWFQWWDEVDRGNAFDWFVGALEQRSVRAPAAEEFEGAGTDEARLFLLTIMREYSGPIGARARRELERLIGEGLGMIPEAPLAREDWFLATSQRLLRNAAPVEPKGATAGDR